MRTILPVILLAASVAAGARADDKAVPVTIACETLPALTDRIEYCSQNRFAVESAKSCYERVVRAWNEAPEDLNRILSVATKREATKQEAELVFTHTDYAKTISKLQNLIDVTEANTALVADYPTVMLRDPDYPMPCYGESFDGVQKVVNELDARLKEGRTALSSAAALRGIAVGRDDHIQSESTARVIRGGGAEGSGVKRGQSPRPASTITGVEESRRKEAPQKEILESFPARDQLLGP